jgi:maltose O-acetyltransferase
LLCLSCSTSPDFNRKNINDPKSDVFVPDKPQNSPHRAFNRSFDNEQKRAEILKSLFRRTGKKIHVEPAFRCDYGENTMVGENFYANFNCVILDAAEVRIGNNCFMAPQVGIYTSTHPLHPAERNRGFESAKPVLIGNNCWIGGQATINPRVTLGDNVVKASVAFVTKSFGDNVVIGGNPSRVIKEIPVI